MGAPLVSDQYFRDRWRKLIIFDRGLLGRLRDQARRVGITNVEIARIERCDVGVDDELVLQIRIRRYLRIQGLVTEETSVGDSTRCGALHFWMSLRHN